MKRYLASWSFDESPEGPYVLWQDHVAEVREVEAAVRMGLLTIEKLAKEKQAAEAAEYRRGVEAFRDLAIADWSPGTVYSMETARTWLEGVAARVGEGGKRG